MIQKTSSLSDKPKRVTNIRESPYGCGTHRSIKTQRTESGAKASQTWHEPEDNENYQGMRHAHSVDSIKEDESFDVIMKKAGFNLGCNGNVGRGRLVSYKRKFSAFGSKVQPLTLEEATKLIQSRHRRGFSKSSTNIERKVFRAKTLHKHRNSPHKEKHKLSNSNAPRENTRKTTHNKDERRSNHFGRIQVRRRKQITEVLSTREKVIRALRLFKLLFGLLEQDKETSHGESKIVKTRVDFRTRTILKKEGIHLNGEKMIGPVPGIKVGDVFQYKAELNLIGLHFDLRGGIDYKTVQGLKLATSIISSEGNGYGYSDRFDSDVIIYTGQGGQVMNKNLNVIGDQKLVSGNLALYNSMKEKTVVRVICGKQRSDRRGKRYVYIGLFLVEDYRRERGSEGKVLLKFKLRRVSGQPPIDLRH